MRFLGAFEHEWPCRGLMFAGNFEEDVCVYIYIYMSVYQTYGRPICKGAGHDIPTCAVERAKSMRNDRVTEKQITQLNMVGCNGPLM